MFTSGSQLPRLPKFLLLQYCLQMSGCFWTKLYYTSLHKIDFFYIIMCNCVFLTNVTVYLSIPLLTPNVTFIVRKHTNFVLLYIFITFYILFFLHFLYTHIFYITILHKNKQINSVLIVTNCIQLSDDRRTWWLDGIWWWLRGIGDGCVVLVTLSSFPRSSRLVAAVVLMEFPGSPQLSRASTPQLQR